MEDARPWDLLVVGGGTAGLVGAKTAARMGARVLLVERDRTGGDCLYTGCVPSKSLLAAAGAAAAARRSSALGVHVSDVRVDFAEVMDHVRRAITTIEPADSPASIEETGASVQHGTVRFTGSGTADVDGRAVRFSQALLATGASPTMPPVPGLAETDALTSETVWDLDVLPGRLVVLGGGNIGCELGQAFARLGAEVTIVEGAERLLPREDPEAAEVVARHLAADGVRALTGSQAAAVRPDDTDPRAGTLVLHDGTEVGFDRLLVAVGRTPRTADLGLDRIGVETDERGFVVVDDHLRTTHPRVWAAGDLTGHPQFTHTAGTHGSLAGSNAVLGVRRSVDLAAIPRVTYTSPEVAAVGADTGEVAAGLRVLRHSHDHVDRAVTEGQTDGFSKLVVDRRGRVVGALVVGPRAGETLGELALAISRGLRTRDLGGVMHAYPTWNDGPWNAALGDLREQLERPATRRTLRALVRTRRWWLSHRPA